MKSNVHDSAGLDWRRFRLLFGMFFVAFCVAGAVPTPGSWTDLRSQWLSPTLIAIVCLIFIITTAVTYWRGTLLTGFQASLLFSLFGILLAYMIRDVFVSIIFLRDVESSQATWR